MSGRPTFGNGRERLEAQTAYYPARVVRKRLFDVEFGECNGIC